MYGITVKEFDRIDEKFIREELDKNKVSYKKEFEDLLDFISEFVGSPENDDAYDFFQVKSDRKGKYISIRDYVGLIQLKSGFQIEILPKINIAKSSKEIKTIFLKMLRSLKDFDSKKLNISNLNVGNMNLYEIFISLYLQKVLWLVKRGLKSNYISKVENLNVLKGKLLLKEQILKNNIHSEKFYCQFDEYQMNTPENKIIKSTLIKLLHASENRDNIKLCRQLLAHFEMINVSTNYELDFSKIVINRNNRDYEVILNWSKVFLKNKSFTTFSGKFKAKALLFKMDKLFESYVCKFVKRIANSNFTVTTQDSRYFLFDDNQKFKIRPDIVLRKKDKAIAIMDTKWKNLINDENKNYGISQEDMYQMYAYSKKYGENETNPEVWLLYPQNEDMKDKTIPPYKEDAQGVIVHIYFVDVSNIEKSISDLINKINQETSITL